MRTHRPVLTLLVLLALTATPRAEPAPTPSDADRISALRDEASALVLVQSVLSWYTRTVGEPAMAAETYKGHASLFSVEAVKLVARFMPLEKDADRRRALQFFKSYLASEYINQSLARFDDEAQNAELRATVTLPFSPEPVPYKQLDLLSAAEKDAGRRVAIEAARAKVWKESLNPILEKKEREGQRLARDLGYRSYVDLAEEFRMVDLKSLIVESDRFRAATEKLYAEMLAEQAQKQLGLKVSELHRADIGRLRKMPGFEKFFPKDLMIPAFRHFLAGLGLDMKTVAGSEILVDDALHPQKEPRAACYSIRVPGDIRVSVKPVGGLDDFVTFFHEGGHALHYANATTTVWEFQLLGPYALTEALAETFGHAWDDPAWLRRYRDFVKEWNTEHKTQYAVMTDADMAALVRARIFEELYFLRRYGAAKLIYESALHGGDPSLWKAVWPGPADNLMNLYRDLFGRAYGFTLTDEDALRYRTDVDDLFYAADYMRAFGLANLIHEGMRGKFGDDWFGNKEAGAFLKKELFAGANKVQPDEVARLFNQPGFTLRPSEARYKRLLGGR